MTKTPQIDGLPTNAYATDGKCHNANKGTFNHECGRTAVWLGATKAGFWSGFCERCKIGGDEARDVAVWRKIDQFTKERLDAAHRAVMEVAKAIIADPSPNPQARRKSDAQWDHDAEEEGSAQ
jgi:hypothetical protein